MEWYENDGSENFTRNTIASQSQNTRKVSTADVDQDGDMDVIWANRDDADRGIYWGENDGAGNLEGY